MERIIDITKIPALWTTCDKSQDRHEPMESMLKGLGISALKVSGPITTPYTIGVAKGYIEALSNSKPPFIILEDDATLVFDSPDKVFKVPDNSDALYLGTSIYGRIQKRTTPGGVIAANAKEYMRVFNMLGFHAIIYLTEEYVEHVITLLRSFIDNPVGGCDDPVAETMWAYNVYSVKEPIFYQKDGRSDGATRLPINILLT
tara:strand:- start:8869 stop:9474 length:606 start_codon:yes stop_codon:yes gene_type:complete